MYCKFKKTWFRNVWAMKKVLIPGSSIGIILLAAVMSLTFTGCAPTAEQIRAQELFNQTQMDTWRSVGLVRKEIQVDSHRIVYLEGGQGETVLLLHGFACDKSYWTYFAEPLIRDYHVVIPDLAGFGESTKQLGASYNIDSQVKRLDRFAEVLHLERFHLAGNSMGGWIAGIYSARFPQKIMTLALLDPWGLMTAKETKSGSQAAWDFIEIGGAGDFDKLLPYFFVKPPPMSDSFKKGLVAQVMAARVYNEAIVVDITVERLALEPFLPMIQAPVCIIWGDQDRILDVSGVPILEKGLKNHQTVIMKDTGHMPMLEKPAETEAAYMSFLKNQRGM
ncbi:MAG: alpha/beta fold hydrolase [Syntrophobacteraceae bacterium]